MVFLGAMKHLALAVALLGAVACGDDDGPRVETTTGGPGGAGGSVPADPWDKPLCPSPDLPLGAIPAARADTAGAMSADGASMMIFGGDVATVVCGETPARDHVADTWVLDLACGGWTEVTGPAPSPRARHSIAADAARGQAVLFGGRFRDAADTMGPYTLYGDVWTFDFAARAWAQLSATGTPPSARSNAATVVAGNELIVFGGSTSTSGLTFTPQNDTHALDLETGVWRSIAATNPPPPRLFHTMAYDEATGRVYVVSGGDENAFLGPFLTDVWALDLATATWHQIATTGLSPDDEGRIKAGLAFRGASDGEGPALFAFAGHDAAQLGARNDVAKLDLSGVTLPPSGPVAWTVVRGGDSFKHKPSPGACDFPPDFTNVDFESPERRQGFALGSRPDGGAFVVFGGDSDCGRLSDAWWFNTAIGTWTPVREALPGLTCLRTGNEACQSLCG